MNRPYRILLDSQGEPGGGSPPSAPDPTEGFRKALEKHQNDGVRLAETLYGENFKLREKLRHAEDRVPGDSDVVLKGDDAKRWTHYRELGEPSEIRKGLGERDAFRTESERYRRAEQYGEVADLHGLNPRAFRRLAEQDRLDFETVDVKDPRTGETKPVAHVKGVDAEGKPTKTPLEKYAQDHWPEFLPSLLQGSTRQESAKPNGTPPRRNANGPPPPLGGDATPEDIIRRSGQVAF